MPRKPAVHTVPYEDGWANRTEGSSRVFGVRPTKSAAESVGRDSARNRGVEQMSHRRDGSIGERRSYGTDLPAARVGPAPSTPTREGTGVEDKLDVYPMSGVP